MDRRKPLRRNAVDIEAAVISKQEKRLRVVILGAQRVGKTQLVMRFLGRPFTEFYIPTIEDFHRLQYIIAGHTYQLDVLDTSGQTLNPTLQNLTLLTGDIFLVVYSTSNRETWNRAKEIVTEIEQVTRDAVRTCECIARNFKSSLLSDGGNIQPAEFSNGILERSKSSMQISPITIFLIGNKSDHTAVEVDFNEAETWLNQWEQMGETKVEHVTISAKTNYMIQGLFDKVFTKSHLPIELSPNRHRRVTANEYSFAVSHLDKSSRADVRGNCDTNKEQLKPVANAIAFHCPSERRPSIETEVLLTISKVRNMVVDSDVTTHDASKMPSTRSGSKVKKQLCKLTGLVLH